MPPVDVTKLNSGRDAKDQLLNEYKSSNTYERLKQAKAMLEKKTNLVWNSVSGPRENLIKEIDITLRLLQPYYENNGKSEMHRISLEETSKMPLASVSNTTRDFGGYIIDVMEQLNKVKTCAELYQNEIEKGGVKLADYMKEAPDEKRIYRYVALDEINSILKQTENLSNNFGVTLKMLGLEKIDSFTMDDALKGPEFHQRQCSEHGENVSYKTDETISQLLANLEGYAICGNVHATKAINELKGIDFSVYYKAEKGKGFAALNKDELKKAQDIAEKIQNATQEITELSEGKKTGELRDLAKELVSEEYAGMYIGNMTAIFRRLNSEAKRISESLKQAEKHPEVFTVPALIHGNDDDGFLAEDSTYVPGSKLAFLFAQPYENTPEDSKKDFFARSEACTNISQAVRELRQEIDGSYVVDEDGYYTTITTEILENLRKKSENLKIALEQNAKTVKDNTATRLMKDVDTELQSMKATADKFLKIFQDALEKSKDFAPDSHENQNFTLAELIDPNPEIRQRMKAVHEERVNALYQKEKEERRQRMNNPDLDAYESLALRMEDISKDRYLASAKNREAMKNVLEKNQAVLDKFKALYATDEYGSYTHYATEAEKQELVDLMNAAQDTIATVIKNDKKGEIPQSFKDTMNAASAMMKSQSEILFKADIAGFFNIAELLDAGKFGFPKLEDAYTNAQGIQRFDWRSTTRKSDQSEPGYELYKNPFEKIKTDLQVMIDRSKHPRNKFSEQEKQWLEELSAFMKENFGDDLIGKYYKQELVEDRQMNGLLVANYPLLKKEDQDKLIENFGKLQDKLNQIGSTEEYRDPKNRNQAFYAVVQGVANFCQPTLTRLKSFNPKLNVSIYTLQEAISGQADTSTYNFRNESEWFGRMHKLPGMAEKLTQAGILMKREDKFEVKDGVEVRKQRDNADIWDKIMTLGKYKDLEWVQDYNDLLADLELLSEFEKDYFRIGHDGQYRDLVWDQKAEQELQVDKKKKINSMSELWHTYEHVNDLSTRIADKAEKFNEGKKPEEQIPVEYVQRLRDVARRAMCVRALTATENAKETHPEYVNVMEMIHSDPDKRKHLWMIKQNDIFHNSRKEEGQTGSYRELENFQYEWEETKTYHGRFYDHADIPTGAQLDGRLNSLLLSCKVPGVNYSQEALDFAQALIEKAKDPNKISAFIPTIEELKHAKAEEIDCFRLAMGSELPSTQWHKTPEDRAMVENVLRGISALGINHVDKAARDKHHVSYGEDITLHPLAIAKLSQELNVDSPTDRIQERTISRTEWTQLAVPGETQQYKGIMVSNTPTYVTVRDPGNVKNNIMQNRDCFIKTGKEILTDLNDPQYDKNLSIEMFNDADTLKKLANLQVICYLVNAPGPKFDDLKFSIEPVDKDGKMKANLMPYMPEVAFLPEKEKEQAGVVKLEDINVMSDTMMLEIKKNFHKDAKEMDKRCKNFAENLLKGFHDPAPSEETVKRMTDIVAKNVKALAKQLVKEDVIERGHLGDTHRMNRGIKEGKILIADSFENLTVDKLAKKNSIFERKLEGRNIFTEISDVPERAMYLKTNKPNPDGAELEKDKDFHMRDNVYRIFSRLNAEAALASFQDKSNEYNVHKWFGGDTKEAKDLQRIMKAIVDFERTGRVYYKTDDENIDFVVDRTGGNFDKDDRDKLKKFASLAHDIVQTYVREKESGIFGGPWRTFGKERLHAAREIEEQLKDVVRDLNVAFDRNPQVKSADEPLKNLQIEEVNPKLAAKLQYQRNEDLKIQHKNDVNQAVNQMGQEQQNVNQQHPEQRKRVDLLAQDQKMREDNRNALRNMQVRQPNVNQQVNQQGNQPNVNQPGFKPGK